MKQFKCIVRHLQDSAIIIALAVMFVSLAGVSITSAGVRIKDITAFHDQQTTDLIGYGLVIGLDGTGDGKNASFTSQSLANMITRLGLTVNAEAIKVKNAASVIVTGKISTHDREGALLDVTVSSVGDAGSLQGGTLLLTPLSGSDGRVYASAQGAVSIGGFNVQTEAGGKIFNNYTLVGRVPNGARVILSPRVMPTGTETRAIRMSLQSPDYSTASRIAARINREYGRVAEAVDDGNILVTVPDSLSDVSSRTAMLAAIGALSVEPDEIARVVINEKTGTIVAGQFVTISPVAIAHGSITVNITATPLISQPEPFSGGETVSTTETRVSVQDEMAHVVELKEAASISDVAQALNAIGATPRDIIAIFQALKQAGALRAELTIL